MSGRSAEAKEVVNFKRLPMQQRGGLTRRIMSVATRTNFILIGSIVIYLAPLLSVYLDERVFRTHYFSTCAPNWAVGIFELFYGFLTDFP
jgi:hypothetical protein